MNSASLSTRRERREAQQEQKSILSTWHNGRFGVWSWYELTPLEQQSHLAAQKRNEYIQTFGIYA
jgi:hypothetical protein